MDLETRNNELFELRFTFTGRFLRRWQIKTAFIECFSSMRPPSGCLQYFTSGIGRLTTFNFNPRESTHLANQLYNICIKKLAGKINNKHTIRFYLSKIPTLNSHFNSHFQLSRSWNSFLKNSHFSKKNSHLYLIESGNLSGN